MTAMQWTSGRAAKGLTQTAAAKALKISQPYLSQLETGLRAPSVGLARKAARLYRLSPAALPLPDAFAFQPWRPDDVEKSLAFLGYPGFEHMRTAQARNPAAVVLGAVVSRHLDTRLVEALPWVLMSYTDLNWRWLRDGAKLQNAQNRLGYLVHLAESTARRGADKISREILLEWESQLEASRLAGEGTLCRDCMPDAERRWLRANRPPAAKHWALLTGITADQLPYAGN